jgi:hypothetical protein
VVFAGPSIAAAEARTILDAEYRPPAAQGDVYRATLARPRAIGLVDGLFGGVPAVWHKEILWAMSRGIHVFGAASMGALRAAELHCFGMVGVGRIFEAYRDGALEEDDEVAVTHGPAEAGYPACSEAMVNVRATLDAAAATGVISGPSRAGLFRAAKALHFEERDWPSLLAAASTGDRALPAAELAALRGWLPSRRVDLKHGDARAMLGLVARWLAQDPAPMEVGYTFAYTDKWDDLVSRAEGTLGIPGRTDASVGAVLEEARIERGGRYAELHRAALLRAVADREARRRGVDASSEDRVEATAEAFRRERGLLGREETEAWLAAAGLGPAGFRSFLEGEARLRWFLSTGGGVTTGHLLDQLRAEGELGRLAARAMDKRRVLEARGLAAPDPLDLGIGVGELIGWFLDRRGASRHGAHLLDCATAFGFDDPDAFLRAVAKEYSYAAAMGPQPGAKGLIPTAETLTHRAARSRLESDQGQGGRT